MRTCYHQLAGHSNKGQGHSFHARASAALVATLYRGVAAPSHAEPLLTRGIGVIHCEKLAPDLKPAEGLNHAPNYLLFYWVQGYISAANIYLLNEYTDYVDLAEVDEKTILQPCSTSARPIPTRSRSPRSTSSSARPRRSTSRKRTLNSASDADFSSA